MGSVRTYPLPAVTTQPHRSTSERKARPPKPPKPPARPTARGPIEPGTVTMAEIAAAFPALATMAKAIAGDVVERDHRHGYLDGPDLVRWMTDEGILPVREEDHPIFAREVRHWRAGRAVGVATVERALRKHGDHLLDDLPDRLWTHDPRRFGGTPTGCPHGIEDGTYPDDVVELARAMYAGGERPKAIGAELGVPRDAVTRWVSDLVDSGDG